MADVTTILNKIEEKSNIVIAKLELLRFAEDDASTIKKALDGIKKKLDDGEISKFSYATMLEMNKKRATENTGVKKKTWDEIAENINDISDALNELKDIYNAKTDADGSEEIKTKKL
ncbi:MAG TPA: hypothetical protein PK685_02380 [archaeon]|jgi:uncharacterized membrane protein YukC|nr:hypothetical protein [archaeon]